MMPMSSVGDGSFGGAEAEQVLVETLPDQKVEKKRSGCGGRGGLTSRNRQLRHACSPRFLLNLLEHLNTLRLLPYQAHYYVS